MEPRINLVGATTLGDPWRRHILNSAQLLPHLPINARSWSIIGSGAGLPGLVLAVMGVARGSSRRVRPAESGVPA